MEIIELKNRRDLLEAAVDFIWEQWGTEGNYSFYYNCMLHSLETESDLPRFYLALKDDKIIGSYAMLRNDLISRQDLTPWFACLYIIPEFRGNGLGNILLEHAREEARNKGYENLYLCTDLDGYYEKYGWEFLDKGYIFNGEPTKIYIK